MSRPFGPTSWLSADARTAERTVRRGGMSVSQFENHVRAILGYPLGNTSAYGYSAMINLIGTVPPIPEILKYREAHLHLYGKHPRPGRKLGHIAVHGDDAAVVRQDAERIRSALLALTKAAAH